MNKYACQFEQGATVTVFAPYDCGNNCPFCVNKKDYKENPNFDVGKVCEAIRTMHAITPRCDFVVTGGEPLADLDALNEILDTIREGHKIFINSTLPTNRYTIEELAEFLNSKKERLSGLNVSRHMRPYVAECDERIFDLLEVPVRINCVLFKAEEGLAARDFVRRFSGRRAITGFQFREDYTTTTLDNLYVFNDENETFRCILESFYGKGAEQESFFKENLIFGNDFRWNCRIAEENGKQVSFHRTLPFSTIELEGGRLEINDIIVNPRGEIMSDWNEYGKPLDVEAYRKIWENSK